MARYVLASKRHKGAEARKRAAGAAAAAFSGLFEASSQVVGVSQDPQEWEPTLTLFDIEADEAAAKRKLLNPDEVWFEHEILHHTATETNLNIQVFGNKRPLLDASVTPFYSGVTRNIPGQTSHTDARGAVHLSRAGSSPLNGLLVESGGGFWSRIVAAVPPDGTINLQPLPPGPLGWWHELMGIRRYDEGRGSSITIGVIDSGVGPHDALAHISNLGAYTQYGAYQATEGGDVAKHGTHVCGLISGRTLAQVPAHYAGVAPGARVHSIRVFPGGGGLANQADIMLALRHLMKENVDLVNISLVANEGSQIINDAIEDARDAGILCLCAAGNAEESPPWFPAQFKDTVAVTAIGLAGWGPADSLSRGWEPKDGSTERYGADAGRRVFFPSFSCYGNAERKVDCTGPGVGIISCVPGTGGNRYGEMSGTSMATPLVTGVLAAILSKRPDYLEHPRTKERTELARSILHLNCHSLGLAETLVGKGLPVFDGE